MPANRQIGIQSFGTFDQRNAAIEITQNDGECKAAASERDGVILAALD